MPSFVFQARDQSGAACSGTLVADSAAAVGAQLRAEGKYPTLIRDAQEQDAQKQLSPRGIRLSRAEVIEFTQQLSVMIETGVTLCDALECMGTQAIKPAPKQLIADLHQQVREGNDFSSAMARHPRTFPRLLITLIKAGEKSGMMGKLLARATVYLRDEQDTRRRVRGALTYPGIMLGFAISTTIFLMAFVMPKFTTIYASKNTQLPGPTRLLMALSDGLVGHWMGLLAGVGTAAGLAWWYFHTPGGRRVWHYVQLRIPLLGPVFAKVHLARGLRMVGTMATSGVNLMDCVATAKDLAGNGYYADLWADVSQQIEAGHQLSEPLFRSKLVPRSVTQMLHSGEKGGKLSFVMEQVAMFSEQELKEKIADLTRYIEPAMIVVMGFIIGGVALALLLPIFTISRVMAGQ